MANKDWANDEPTEKQIALFDELKSVYGYDGTPKNKGDYRNAISELMAKQQSSQRSTYNDISVPMRRNSWMDAYDDDYLGDQGIFPGY